MNKQTLPNEATITVIGRRWFEKTNGNTYHSVEVYVNGDMIERLPFSYGYGSMYAQNALTILDNHYRLPNDMYINHPSTESIKAYTSLRSLWRLKELGYHIIDSVTDVTRKKDL